MSSLSHFRRLDNRKVQLALAALVVFGSFLHPALPRVFASATPPLIILTPSIRRKGWLIIAVLVYTLLADWYHNGSDLLFYNPRVSSEPLLQSHAPAGTVLLGGEIISFHSPESVYVGRVSFHTPQGTFAIGHGMPAVSASMTVRVNGVALKGPPVMTQSELGILIEGVPPPSGVREMTLLSPGDIDLESEAYMLNVDVPVPLEISGFALHEGQQFLVFRFKDKDFRLSPGMSGSPIFQGESIIGVVATKFTFPYKPPMVGRALLASDMYHGLLRDHTERPE